MKKGLNLFFISFLDLLQSRSNCYDIELQTSALTALRIKKSQYCDQIVRTEEVPLPNLSIRLACVEDADFINQHWEAATDQDLQRLGELARPHPKDTTKFLQWFVTHEQDPKTMQEDMRMWCADSVTVGYSTLKEIHYGSDAQIHLHLARPHWRQGYGTVCFCLSAQDFIAKFELRQLYCQPHAENPMPNGMLQKVGFRMLETIEYTRADGSVIRQNRYLIDLPTIKKYLDSVGKAL